MTNPTDAVTAPPAPSSPTPELTTRARESLRRLVGRDDADFRDGQLEAVAALVGRPVAGARRAAHRLGQVGRLLRRHRPARGPRAPGPTVIVSPLLALMRDQIAAAERAGIRAVTMNSANAEEWDVVREALAADEVDVLLVSPERLNNPRFRDEQLPDLAAPLRPARRRRGALHQRLGPRLPARLPPHPRPARRRCPADTPVLATTATANARVVTDVVEQLGAGGRDGAHRARRPGPRLAAARRAAARRRPSSGSAGWSRTSASCPAAASSTPSPSRPPRTSPRRCREAGHDGRVLHRPHRPRRPRARSRARCAATRSRRWSPPRALGMGFDKPDLGFVVHLGAPSLAGRLLPAGRPRRPRHRARRRAAAARARGPRHLALLRLGVDAARGAGRRRAARAGRVGPGRCRRRRSRPSSTCAAPGSSCCSRCSTSTAPCSGCRAAGSPPGEPWAYDAERYARVAAAREAEQQLDGRLRAHRRAAGWRFLQEALDDDDRRAVRPLRRLRRPLVPHRRCPTARCSAARAAAATAPGVELEPARRSGRPAWTGSASRSRAGSRADEALRAGPGGGPAHRPRLGPAAARAARATTRPAHRRACCGPASPVLAELGLGAAAGRRRGGAVALAAGSWSARWPRASPRSGRLPLPRGARPRRRRARPASPAATARSGWPACGSGSSSAPSSPRALRRRSTGRCCSSTTSSTRGGPSPWPGGRCARPAPPGVLPFALAVDG